VRGGAEKGLQRGKRNLKEKLGPQRKKKTVGTIKELGTEMSSNEGRGVEEAICWP